MKARIANLGLAFALAIARSASAGPIIIDFERIGYAERLARCASRARADGASIGSRANAKRIRYARIVSFLA